jgi:hypothetical protein
LNVSQLAELGKTLVIQDNDKPLAVLLKYEHFLAMQELISPPTLSPWQYLADRHSDFRSR